MSDWYETFQVPQGWILTGRWGDAFACQQKGLRLLIDCETKADGNEWIHVSVSRKDWTPSHVDMSLVKHDFLGDRYAYAVWPPSENYVNIHPHCLHLWARRDGAAMLPEFSEIIEGLGRSI